MHILFIVVEGNEKMTVDAKNCETSLTPDKGKGCTDPRCDKACKDRFGPNAVGKCTILSLYCICDYPC